MAVSEFDSQFGQKVKSLRKQAGLTQDQLAARIDRTPDTISNIERGISPPRLRTAKAIADALSVDIGVLFQFSPSPQGRPELQEALTKMADLLDGCEKRTLDAVIRVTETLVGLSRETEKPAGE